MATLQFCTALRTSFILHNATGNSSVDYERGNDGFFVIVSGYRSMQHDRSLTFCKQSISIEAWATPARAQGHEHVHNCCEEHGTSLSCSMMTGSRQTIANVQRAFNVMNPLYRYANRLYYSPESPVSPDLNYTFSSLHSNIKSSSYMRSLLHISRRGCRTRTSLVVPSTEPLESSLLR